jgi:hypothetical protein
MEGLLGVVEGPAPRFPASRRFAVLRRLAPSVLLFALLSAASTLDAQAEFTDTTLQGELWLPFQAAVPGELEKRVPDQKKLDDLLEEMQTVFSGMVYGWSFTYRPADPERKVAEFLDVKSLGRIVGTTGDPATSRAIAVSTRLDEENGILTVLFRYYMPSFEAARRQAWASVDIDQAAGVGKAKAVDRLESRLDALRQAVKEAVHNLLRPRFNNRPQEIRGEALLREVPRYYLQSGQYVCSAQFQMRILNVREYSLY